MGDSALQRWLDKTVSQRGDVASALVVFGAQGGATQSTQWPADRPCDSGLLAAAQASLAGASAAATPEAATDAPGERILTRSVRRDGKVVGALAMRLNEPPPVPPAAAAPDTAQAASAHLAVGRRADSQASDALLTLIRTALAAPRFDRSAGAVATELATAFVCDRVFVGMTARRFVQVAALSHGARTGAEQPLMRVVGAAMDEAVDQGASLLYPQHPQDRPRILLAHAELANRNAGVCLLTVPMFAGGLAVGALTLERAHSAGFDAETVSHIETIASALAPLLLLKHALERSAFERIRAALRSRLATLGPGQRRAAVLFALIAAGALAALLGSNATYRVSAPTRLEGQVQRAVVAPVDGFLKSAHVRAGDSVRAGQLLAELSDEDLLLERRRWETEVARHQSTYADAQAKQDRTQLVIADARVAESRAQLALVEQQLGRTQLLAPFDALVIKGDLAQQLGAPVKRGDLLLTLTPSREFRVMLEIDERDVGEIRPGARGAVTLSALPEQRFDLVVDRVMPVARSDAGRNLFEAEAHLDPSAAAGNAALRPGMQGVARLDAGQHRLVWLASHRVVDWLRLQWWSWVG